jgi:hypothetical protein
MHVVHRHPGPDSPIQTHHLLLSDGSIRASEAEGPGGGARAVGTVAVMSYGGTGRVPELHVREEVMHALAEVGFSHSVQSTAIMDCTLSGVLQVLFSFHCIQLFSLIGCPVRERS